MPKPSTTAKFAELRALRASGKRRLDNYEIDDQGAVYDEVDEEGYKNVVRRRLNEDDFVVDDQGEGYADDGREEWQTTRQYHSSDEDSDPRSRKTTVKSREDKHENSRAASHKIMNYFSNAPAVTAQQPKKKATAEDEAFMAGLLGELDTNTLPARSHNIKVIKSEHRRKVRILSPPPTGLRKSSSNQLVDNPPFQEGSPDEDGVTGSMDDDYDLSMSDPLSSSPIVKAVARKASLLIKSEEGDEEEEDLTKVAQAQAFGHEGAPTTYVNMKANRPAVSALHVAPITPESSSPTLAPIGDVGAPVWDDITAKLKVVSSPAFDDRTFGKMLPQDAVEEDGSLKMFWLDYTEVNGSLCLFGKVKDRKTGKFASAFVKIDNILRKLYFLPRECKRRQGRDTSDEVAMEDVYQEVAGLMSKLKVKMHKIKPCARKYAFELPDVPKESEYLKLLYPYDKPTLPIDTEGDTFSRVFGTNTALFEQFVLFRNIMGPCWLRIEAADFTAVNNASWCKLECAVRNPALITPISDSENLEEPRLTLMSLAFRSKLNVKENKQEIMMISARVYEDVSLTDTTSPETMTSKTFTVMRPLESSYPPGFEAECKKQRGTFMLEKSEQFLLSKFLAMFERTDPDVLMGFQLQEVDYSILLSRMREKKTPGWHRVGRMKRGDWPKTFNKGGSSFFAERNLLSGRLMCDLANDMGKSLMTKCQQWSLSEICRLYLGSQYIRQDLDNETVLKTWATTRHGLLKYVNHCHADTFFVAALVLKLQILPLTKVLTNLAGNSWARTLSGTRAERNEYILLHEFFKNKYICPDKIYGKGRVKLEEEVAEGEDRVDTKKKEKYKGGLVFEPEKGLYDKYILVMDFNSLYPSIIQEFNICFTTVDRSATSENESEEKIPEVPDEPGQGILPKLISNLVNRRRQVKKLMKDKHASAEQLALWDTKQLALKLTANSMYGCLGYTQSRFYARPLAMLTTFKGREILQSTKQLAEDSQLRVIYGDTDSVMINTNADNVADALKVGNEFKRAVNGQYGLLEIDIDNVFRRLLLHAKKKYAAINMVEVDGKFVDKLEVKGLDMKRREYCSLSKEISERLLNEILSGDDAEIVLNNVHEYLREISGKMREEVIPVQKYTIYTKLGKSPDAYPNADSMPQVQVALREISRGKSVRVNDVMSYIVTMGDEKTKGLPAPKRSYTPQDVLKPDSGLQPDIEYYLLKQIFPPIERLCAPIPGTDSVRLAECLGLDTRKYQINTSGSNNQQNLEIFPLESQIPDSVRFKDAARFMLRCRSCHEETVFEGLCASTTMCSASGLICPRVDCQSAFATASIVASLENQIRVQTCRYYEGWLVCDDASCSNRTRQISVYGHRCLGQQGRAEGCLGRMSYEYSEKCMYNQLLYFATLWDVDKARVTARAGVEFESVRERVVVLAESNRAMFGVVKSVVDGYLRKCGRQWVDMQGLFGFAAPT